MVETILPPHTILMPIGPLSLPHSYCTYICREFHTCRVTSHWIGYFWCASYYS